MDKTTKLDAPYGVGVDALVRQWQYIETAPQDGTKILLFGCYSTPTIVIGEWAGKRPPRWIANGYSVPREPTHWMPLPEIPVSA